MRDEQFVVYWQHCESWLIRTISYHTKTINGQEAKDIAQDVAEIAWQRFDLDRCENKDQFAKWVKTIMLNKISNMVRDQKRNYRMQEIPSEFLLKYEHIQPSPSAEEEVLHNHSLSPEMQKHVQKIFKLLIEWRNHKSRTVRNAALVIHTMIKAEIGGQPLTKRQAAQLFCVSETQICRYWTMFEAAIDELGRR